MVKQYKIISKVFILTVMYFALSFASFTLSSCEGLLNYEVTICDIEFYTITTNMRVKDNLPDTLSNKIEFGIDVITQTPTCFIPSFQLMNSAFATTKCAVYNNQLLKSSYQLSFNHPMMYNSDTIDANTNILSLPNIMELIDIEIRDECKFMISTIIFRNELTDKLSFDTSEYQVTFMCSTSDNKKFHKTKQVVFIK